MLNAKTVTGIVSAAVMSGSANSVVISGDVAASSEAAKKIADKIATQFAENFEQIETNKSDIATLKENVAYTSSQIVDYVIS